MQCASKAASTSRAVLQVDIYRVCPAVLHTVNVCKVAPEPHTSLFTAAAA